MVCGISGLYRITSLSNRPLTNQKPRVASLQWGSIDAKSQQRAVLFGFWDQQHGLDRLPVNPIVNIGKLEHTVRPVLDNIELMAPQLPFTPIDDYELWLLDSAR